MPRRSSQHKRRGSGAGKRRSGAKRRSSAAKRLSKVPKQLRAWVAKVQAERKRSGKSLRSAMKAARRH